MGIVLKSRGSFKHTDTFLRKIINMDNHSILQRYANYGVQALSSATPIESGKTASSWSYEIVDDGKSASICWYNSNINKGVNIAIILQYGHGTRNGGYVKGIDYINPALRPIFEELADKIWKEVTSA